MDSLNRLEAAAADRVAAQWTALGGQLADIDERTAVDLEALVATTASLDALDPRVRGVAIDWVVQYGHVLHAGRLRRVAAELDVVVGALARFAGEARSAGGPRWPFADRNVPGRSRGKVVARDLSHPARTIWRVRAAFGVSVRSDVLAVLLTTPVVPNSIANLAARTRFTKVAVANAVAGMSLSGIVVKTRVGNEDRVTLERRSPIRTLFEPDGVPDIDWATRWSVILHLLAGVRALDDAPATARLVETRTLTETAVPLLGPAALPRPNLSVVGIAWPDAFEEWLDALAVHIGLMGA